MQALDSFPLPTFRGIRYLLTDIDDTLTTSGQLSSEAYQALTALKTAGIEVIPVTGRPAGWCDHMARMWPVSAIVGENGAFYFRYDTQNCVLKQRFLEDEMLRDLSRQRLMRLHHRIQTLFPQVTLASDQFCRVADLAIDICEDVTPLTEAEVESILSLARDDGATAKLSSIHVNIWYGDYNKLSMTKTLFSEVFNENLEAVESTCIFVGDSPNDSPMFDFFSNSIGVANVQNFGDKLDRPPKYVTESEAGQGFVEVAERLIAARKQG